MDAPPPDVVTAMMCQVAQEREEEQQSATGTACTAPNTAEEDHTHQMQLECAAGALCDAPHGTDLSASTHHCLNCCGKIHCAFFCGKIWGGVY